MTDALDEMLLDEARRQGFRDPTVVLRFADRQALDSLLGETIRRHVARIRRDRPHLLADHPPRRARSVGR
jgi:hypothetical protein